MAFILLSVSCSLADPDLFRALEGDGGMVDTGDIDAPMADAPMADASDAGSGIAVDRCGDEDVTVLLESTPDIEIDTTGLTNRIGSLGGCGNLGVPGNDGFLAVDVLEGEEWHFHLRVHPEEDAEAVLNPTLYVLNSSCAGGACSPNLLANFCEARGEEHFAFTFDTSGRFYIGIDDTNPGGGRICSTPSSRSAATARPSTEKHAKAPPTVRANAGSCSRKHRSRRRVSTSTSRKRTKSFSPAPPTR